MRSLLESFQTKRYPGQFWLMVVGMLISTIGASMIWPFLMVYVSSQLNLPLMVVSSLMTINSAAGLVSSLIVGPIIDRLGRKWAMVISLGLLGGMYLLYTQAHTYAAFAALMILSGAINPLYRVGADAMVADLIPEDKRLDAYAIMRMSNNLGVAIGPALGGFIASSSYTVAFLSAATGMVTYSLLLTFFARETLPAHLPETAQQAPVRERFGGYNIIFKDRPFMGFIFALILGQMCATMVWVLMAVYLKTNFGILEREFGWIASTNAIMVVTLQVYVTNITKRYPSLPVLAVGVLLYAVSMFMISLSTGFWGFWISMVVLTFGELTLVPTANAYTARRAPAHMRGRYMSIFGLTWGISHGVGAVLGGLLNDTLGPVFIWIGAGIIALVGFAFLLYLMRVERREAQTAAPLS